MRGILADINVEGVVAHLALIWLSATWRELWLGLGISMESFETLGFRPDSPDTLIWRSCQEQAIVLITGNRNAEGPNSLEMVIRGAWRREPIGREPKIEDDALDEEIPRSFDLGGTRSEPLRLAFVGCRLEGPP
jgi:hypothetical protein